MLEILKFIFSNIWTFLGSVILIYAVGENLTAVIIGIVKIVIATKYKNEVAEQNDNK